MTPPGRNIDESRGFSLPAWSLFSSIGVETELGFFLPDLDFSRLRLETVPLVRAIAEGHHAGAATAAPRLNGLSVNHY